MAEQTQYSGGYKAGQTRPVYFKGRQAYDPSPRLFKEAEDTAKRDASILKDMEKQEKQLSEAYKVWNDNQKLLDEELITFWKEIGKVPEIVKDTWEAGSKIVRAENVEKANKWWEDASDEERAEAKDYFEKQLKEGRDIDDKREEMAKEIEAKTDNKELPDFLRGQSKTYQNTLMVQVGKEHLFSFNEVADSVWADKNLVFNEGTDNEFRPTDPKLNSRQQSQVWSHIRKKMLPGMAAGGLDLTAANAILGGELDKLIGKKRWQQNEQRSRTNANAEQTEALSTLDIALSFVEVENGRIVKDPLGAAQLITSYSENAYGRLSRGGSGTPGLRAKNDLERVLTRFGQREGGESEAIILALTAGPDAAKYLIPGTTNKYGTLSGNVDSQVFGIDNLTRGVGGGEVRLSNGDILPANDPNNIRGQARVNSGWDVPPEFYTADGKLRTDLTKEQQELLESTAKYQLDKRVAEGGTITYEELLDEAKLARAAGADRKTLYEILTYQGNVLSADQTLTYLNGLDTRNGELVIPTDAPQLDPDTVGDYAQRHGLVEAEPYTNTDAESRLMSWNRVTQAVTEGKTDQPTYAQIIVEEELEDRIVKKEKELFEADRLQEGGSKKTREQIIKEATDIVLAEFEKETKTEGHKYFRTADGDFSEVATENRRGWFGWTTAARRAADKEIRTRGIIKQIRNQNAGDKPLYQTQKIPGIRNLLVTSNGSLTHTGSMPQELVALAAAHGTDVFTLQHAQIDAYGLDESLKVPIPDEAKSFLSVAKGSDIQDLIFSLSGVKTLTPQSGYSPSSTFRQQTASAAAHRKVSTLINKTTAKNGVIRPNDVALRNAFSYHENGNYSAVNNEANGVRPDGKGVNPHLGRYRITRENAKLICKQLGIDYPGDEGFLADTKLQDRVYNARISTLIDKAEGNTLSQKLTWIYQNWSGSDNPDEAIFFLKRYETQITGG